MSKNIKYRVSETTVTATCKNPRNRCMLINFFTPLRNLRVLTGKNANKWFECVVMLRNREEYDVEKGKADILDIMKQVCPQCQKQR